MKETFEEAVERIASKIEKFGDLGKSIEGTKASDILNRLMGHYLVSDSDGFAGLDEALELAQKIEGLGLVEIGLKKYPDEELESLLPEALEEVEKQAFKLCKERFEKVQKEVKEGKAVKFDKEGIDILIDQCKDDTDAIKDIKSRFVAKGDFDEIRNLLNAIFNTPSEEKKKEDEKQIMMDLDKMLEKEEQKDNKSLFDKRNVVCNNVSVIDPLMCKGICSICSFNKENNKNINKKAMISQPMTGRTKDVIEFTRKKATEKLAKMGYEVVNTYFPELWDRKDDLKEEGYKHLDVYYLGKAITRMSRCDAVYFCKGWLKSSGCKIEHDIARLYGIPCFFEEPEEFNK
jgi:hypothetical protein